MNKKKAAEKRSISLQKPPFFDDVANRQVVMKLQTTAGMPYAKNDIQTFLILNSFLVLTPRLAGMVLIAFGLLTLVWGLAEYHAEIRQLKKSYPNAHKSKASMLGILILMLGLALFLAALFRQ